MHVVVAGYGASLGKKSERLVVRVKGETRAEVPFFDVDQVTVEGTGVSLSANALYECWRRGIDIQFLTPGGEPYAAVLADGLVGTVLTRRAQLRAYDTPRAVALAKTVLAAKLRNQASVLRYFGKYRKAADPDGFARLQQAVEGITRQQRELTALGEDAGIDAVRDMLMGLEGQGARIYWGAVGDLLAPRAAFPGREHRGSTDPVNALLNYGYGILYHQITRAVVTAGLDPYGGFLHADRPGKLSLVLDLMEVFRPSVVDRAVLGHVLRSGAPELPEGRLEWADRRSCAEHVLARLDTEEPHQGKRTKLSVILQLHARAVAAYLRDEANFKPHISPW